MKKSNNIMYVLCITVIFATIIAIGIAITEEFVGADVVFVSAIILLPITFTWMLLSDYIQRKRTK